MTILRGVLRGVIVNGAEAPAHLRGIVRNGIEVGGSLQGVVGGGVPRTVLEHSDFSVGPSGGLYGFYAQQGIIGDGPDSTTYQITPNSSTKNPPHPGVNPLYVMCVGSLSSTPATGVVAGNFTIQGTPQGHLFGGLRVAGSDGAYIHDVTVKGVPGDAAGPAAGNETMALNMYDANNIHLKNITLLGLDPDGNAVMSTGLGFNFQTGILVENLVVHNAVHGMGVTWWECTSAEMRGADMRNNRKPVNLERCYDGQIDIYDMDVRGYTNSVPATVNSDQGSTRLTFYDPIWDTTTGPFKIGIAPNGYSGNQHQQVSDVHVVISGVDVTGDPSKVYVGSY